MDVVFVGVMILLRILFRMMIGMVSVVRDDINVF